MTKLNKTISRLNTAPFETRVLTYLTRTGSEYNVHKAMIGLIICKSSLSLIVPKSSNQSLRHRGAESDMEDKLELCEKTLDESFALSK